MCMEINVNQSPPLLYLNLLRKELGYAYDHYFEHTVFRFYNYKRYEKLSMLLRCCMMVTYTNKNVHSIKHTLYTVCIARKTMPSIRISIIALTSDDKKNIKRHIFIYATSQIVNFCFKHTILLVFNKFSLKILYCKNGPVSCWDSTWPVDVNLAFGIVDILRNN